MSSRLFGELVVNYPRAIPQKQWVLDRLLWADQIGCVWPAGEPTDRNHAEAAMLKDIDLLRDAKLFNPCMVPGPSAEALGADIAAGLKLTNVEMAKFVDSAGVDPSVAPPGSKAERLPESVDRSLFFYINKMPPEVVSLLEEHDVAKRDANGWLQIRSADDADKLMSIVARHAQPFDRPASSVMLEAPRATDLARAAAPTPGSNTAPAVRIELPLIRTLDSDLDVKRLIDLRSSDRANKARKRYLDRVNAYLDCATVDEGAPERAERAIESIRKEILAATEELERACPWRDPSIAVGAMAAVVTTAQVHSPLAAAGAVLAGAAVALGVRAGLRPSSVDGYLLTLHSKGFL